MRDSFSNSGYGANKPSFLCQAAVMVRDFILGDNPPRFAVDASSPAVGEDPSILKVVMMSFEVVVRYFTAKKPRRADATAEDCKPFFSEK